MQLSMSDAFLQTKHYKSVDLHPACLKSCSSLCLSLLNLATFLSKGEEAIVRNVAAGKSPDNDAFLFYTVFSCFYSHF